MTAAQHNYLVIVDTLKANRGAEAKAIQAMFGGDRKLMDQFLAVCFSLLQANPKILTDCDPMSVVQAVKDAASMGLTPLTDEAAIVPYGRTAKLMPMWRGYVKRIRNSREVTELDCQIVYMGDEFQLALGTNPSIHHVPVLYGEKDDEGKLLAQRGDYRGVYAWALMPSGKYVIEYMSADDVNAVRDTWGNKRARSGEPLPWETSWPEMARKTVIRRLAKRLPSAAVDKLLAADKATDDAREELEKVQSQVNSGLQEVQRLAIEAVTGGRPQPLANEEPTETSTQETGQPDAPTTADGPSSSAEAEPGVDPNVAAAMAEAERQELLDRQKRR